MPYATNGQTRVYYEVVGDGPPLVLQHSFTLSLSQWQHSGVVDALNPEYRLILIDARGHGTSDKPHDAAAYTFTSMASDVVAVLDDLTVERAHFLGYSMGAKIGFGVAAHYPDRLMSLVAGGASPNPLAGTQLMAFTTFLRQGIEAFLAAVERTSANLPDWFRESVLRNDPDVLIAMLESWEREPGERDLLARLTMPTFLFCGDRDPAHDLARDAARDMPNATFQSFTGHGHIMPASAWLPDVHVFLRQTTNAPTCD